MTDRNIPFGSRYSIIDWSRMPPFVVIDPVDSEARLRARMLKLKELWTEYDPPLGAIYDVEGLEFDPLKINQEANSFYASTLEDRVNQAARATTLAFASGGDLDAIASRYPGGVPREENETDDRYRHRIWLAANAFTTAGAADAYAYHALTAEPTLRDVSVTKVRTNPMEPQVVVTCLSERADGEPTKAELFRVRKHLLRDDVKPVTDIVVVRPPKIFQTDYRVRVWLFPGPDETAVLNEIGARLAKLKEDQRWLGFDHTRNAVAAAAQVSGVQNTEVIAPVVDILASPRDFVRVDEIVVEYAGRAE